MQMILLFIHAMPPASSSYLHYDFSITLIIEGLRRTRINNVLYINICRPTGAIRNSMLKAGVLNHRDADN